MWTQPAPLIRDDECLLTSAAGSFDAGIELPPASSLEAIETTLGADREEFMQLMRKMLQWMPERRSTAKELLEDPWLKKHLK